MGKERVLSFPVPPFLGTRFFPVFGQNHEKRVKKEVERPKNGWKDVEQRGTAVLRCSIFSNLARFRFYRLKPPSAPVPTRFLPRSNPIFTPFFSRSCTALLSYLDARQLQPNHWTTSDHHWSAGPVGGLYSWQGDARDQFGRYIYSRAWEQVKRQRQEGDGAGCTPC